MNDENLFGNDEIEDLRMILLGLFISIKQLKGLVFNPDFRKRLKKSYPQYEFSPTHDLEPEGEEIDKIKVEIRKLDIFNKKSHNVRMTD